MNELYIKIKSTNGIFFILNMNTARVGTFGLWYINALSTHPASDGWETWKFGKLDDYSFVELVTLEKLNNYLDNEDYNYS